MSIVFFCQSCGARFDVDPRLAGNKGHCKKCGQYMAIPRADEIASLSAVPALAAAPVGASAGAAGSPAGPARMSYPDKIGLVPITEDRIRIGTRKRAAPSPLDDAEDSKPYALAQPEREYRGRVTMQDNAALRVWRRQIGGLERLFRKINQAAYLVSVPFLMILLLGVLLHNRPMALFGATVVVLLNIGRLVSGVANLALVPLRDGLNFSKMKKSAGRVIEPALTIGLVGLAFAFIPWLSGGKPAEGSTADRVRSDSPAAASRPRLGGRFRSTLDALEKKTTEEMEKAKALGDPKNPH
jgi:hypothetical protein